MDIEYLGERDITTNYYMYSKSKADEVFVAKNATMPAGKTVTDTVTFQDLIDLGIIADPNA